MKTLNLGIIGISNSIFSYVLFVILIRFGIFYLFASTISFVTGTIFSYVLNSRYIFRSKVNVRTYIRFFIVSLISLFMSLVLLFVLKGLLFFNVYLAQIAVILVRFPIVYTINRDKVFGIARGAG